MIAAYAELFSVSDVKIWANKLTRKNTANKTCFLFVL